MPQIKIDITDEIAALIDRKISNGEYASRREFAKSIVQKSADTEYLDSQYTTLNAAIIEAIQAQILMMEERLGNRLARSLGDIGIEVGIMNQLLLQLIDVDADELDIYRSVAANNISETGAILKYKDLIK